VTRDEVRKFFAEDYEPEYDWLEDDLDEIIENMFN